jgi:DNA-binding MarR family transcriptional regulator
VNYTTHKSGVQCRGLKLKNKAIDSILDNLFQVLPIIHKRLLSMDMGGVTGNLSRLHLAIMGMLGRESLPISEIGMRLVAPKSQMTRLVDQLVSLGIVVRQPDARDRRVTNISLTDHGRAVLRERRELVKKNIREKISCLTSAELATLSDALVKLKKIGAKLE